MIVLLVLALIVIAAVLYVAIPRSGTVDGRTTLLPGQRFTYRCTGDLPILRTLPATTIRWRGNDFKFALVRLANGTFRAYILSQPSYRGWGTELGATHRLSDAAGRMYVCWHPEPRDANQMSAALALWVAGTCVYRATGVFPDARAAAHELSRP